MSVTHVLMDILLVLLAAKLAAEGAERLGVPAVVGEIVAGVIIGPSALHLVGSDDVLKVLGELGVILLLLDVGLEMDLGELAAVGRAAVSVATVGVVVPFAAGGLAALGLGMNGKEAIFVGAALTATSVGITARVFGDLKALATVEARTVLGAAVADDVMGLVILTVVTRLVSEGSVSIGSVTSIVLVAIGFLAVASFVGIRFATPVFRHVNRLSRSGGTLVALALVFTLAVAELANQAKLAPIVGAFVAGLALSRSPLAPRVRRELTPIGHILVPVFFVQIGLDAQVSQFARAHVLAIAGVLLVIAVAGKLAAAAGMWRAPGDRLLVGLGMIPRGEVGLIFATLGLSQGIIGRDVYASLLLVVLASTLMTPSLLKWRVRQQARRSIASLAGASDVPDGGWLTIDDASVDLAATPPAALTVPIGMQVALEVARGRRAGERIVTWIAALPDETTPWTADAVDAFDEVLRLNRPPAWRFLLVTGLLDRSLPEVARALHHRQADPFEADPTRTLTWPRLERLADHEWEHGRILRLAALSLDAADLDPSSDDPTNLATQLARRLGLAEVEAASLVDIVTAAALLPGAARRFDGLDEEPVLRVAGYLGSIAVASDAFALARTSLEDPSELDRLDELQALVAAALSHPQLSGLENATLVDDRRATAAALVPSAADRIGHTPASFVATQEPADLARQAALAEPPLARRCVRAAVTPIAAGHWRIDVAVRDEVGLLARQLQLLGEHGLEVIDVATVVWPDGQSLSTFRVLGERRPRGDILADEIAASLAAPVVPLPLEGAALDFHDDSAPWHTLCTVRTSGPDRALLAVAKALALAGVNVWSARQATVDGARVEVLELSDRRGRPVDPALRTRVLEILRTGATPSLRKRTRPRRSETV